MNDPQDESPAPGPTARPFDFLRKPMFIFSLLFLAWIFFGQAVTRLRPENSQRPVRTVHTPPVEQAAPIGIGASIKASQDDTKIAALERRLHDVEAKVNALESAAATPVKPSDNSAMEAKIAALQANLDTLQQAHSTEAGDTAHAAEVLQKQEQDIAALKAQLADMQTKALRRLALLSDFEAVKDEVMRGESFAVPFKRMDDLAGDDAAIRPLLKQLAPYAGENPVTLSMLQSQFETAVPPALAPDASNPLTRRLESLIRIRKVGGEQTGRSDEAIIARAESKLNRGDIKGSIDETAALSPKAGAAFAAWQKQAQAFQHVHDTLAALQPALLQDMPVAAGVPAKPAPASPAAQ